VYLSYAAVTRDVAQRRYWTFYEAIKYEFIVFAQLPQPNDEDFCRQAAEEFSHHA
jgi:hypothetical protein